MPYQTTSAAAGIQANKLHPSSPYLFIDVMRSFHHGQQSHQQVGLHHHVHYPVLLCIIMYMYTRYHGAGNQSFETSCLPSNIGFGTANDADSNMIDLFLQWNAEDPVSQFEDNRNTYLGNASNTYGQGNRNPFIDNPYLATRIWGGESAKDVWGNYTSSDTEAPSTPSNVSASNQSPSTIDITWTASTDNIGVTQYRVYIDAVLTAQTTETNFQATGLEPGTSYDIQIEARDLINNKSEKSNLITATTTADTNNDGSGTLEAIN